MSGLWTPEQREWLQALGHCVFALAGTGAVEEAVPEPADDERRPARSTGAPPSDPPPTQLPTQPPPSGRMSDRLYRALLRATARRTPREGEALLATVEAFGPEGDLEALRNDPARKRALWIQLRAVRKAHKG